MRSKWFGLRERAIKQRKLGASITDIEKRLGIPRSTLSGWFKSIELSAKQKQKLHQNKLQSLAKARRKAARSHQEQKRKRIARAKQQAKATMSRIDHVNKDVLELALAILYLGEGSKKTIGTALGSSDPSMLRFFIVGLQKVYGVSKVDIRAELHLRADQDIATMQRRWSRELKIPLKNFTYATTDKRTEGSVTYPGYLGVCILRVRGVEIQRRLMFLSEYFCEKIAEEI